VLLGMPKLTVVDRPPVTAMERLVEDYLDHHRGMGHSIRTTRDAYGYPLRTLLLPFCAAEGVEKPSQLTDRHLNRLSGTLLETGHPYALRPKPLAKASVHAYMRAINSFLSWVRKEGEKVEARAPLPKVGRPVIDVLTRAEIQAMEDAADNERDKLIVRLLADTGIRVSELLGLRVPDIVEGDGRHTFLKIRGKGDKERLVPLAPALARRLRRFAEKTRKEEAATNRIFIGLRRRPGSGEYRPLTPSGLGQVIRILAQTARIDKRVHPHLFRHSFATQMLRKGMNPLLLQQTLGHADLTMITKTYSHLNQDDAYEATLKALLED
jgi:site-specific recombinase XerD